MTKVTHPLVVLTVLLILSSACGVVPKTNGMKAGAKGSSNSIETGVASWYGPNFHGKLTANGEVYDMDGMTAAHRTLPFDTEVVVENLDNGLTTKVRINDRGPFAKDRIIDLSRAAATELDMLGPGTARVRLYLVKGDLENSRVTDLKVANYTVQLGSFSDEALAQNRADEINGSRVETLQLNGSTVYRVYFGLYQNPEDAKTAMEELQQAGHDCFVKQIEND